VLRVAKGALLFFLVLSGAAAAAPGSGKRVPDSVQLVPHRAIYNLQLVQSRHGQFAQSMSGWILYDFSGNACDGYVQHLRQTSELDRGRGKGSVNDLSANTWEDGAGTRFRFNSRNRLGEKPVETVDGQAKRGAGGVAVNLTKPGRKQLHMDAGMVFPTEQMRRIITAARAGKTLLALPVYDGSEEGEKVFNTLTVIGHPIPPGERVPTDAAAGQAALAGLTRWPVTISYFDRDAKPGDQTPDYAISFELYENGISRALLLDYNNFVLRGDMVALKIGKAKPCR
jgi:EipB-like